MRRRGNAVMVAAAAAAALAGRYAAGRAQVERAALASLDRRLTDIGDVESLSVLPLVERLVSAPGLRGEPGLSYLLRAGETTVLFDCGLALGRGSTALESNADALGVSFRDLDAVVISHLHADHVGGPRAQMRRTFALSADPDEPAGLPAFVPTLMSHTRADVVVVDAPRVIAPGVAVLPPLGRMLFWLGPIAEQALVVNVRGFGLVLVSGCGHPPMESTLAAAEQVLDVPVRAVLGGLHLPVHPLGTPLMPQAILGNPNWPWHPIDEQDARVVLDAIAARGPRLVAVSSHDSTPWTYDTFGTALGDRYRTLRAGEKLVVDRHLA